MNVSELAKFLQTYNGRDKVIRTLCYGTKWASGVVSSPTAAKKLNSFSSQMSACRATLRLLDDIPMLDCTLSYGLGRQEQDGVLRFIGVLSNFLDQIFYPIDHYAWFVENDYITVKNNPWSTISTAFWVISVYLALMRALRSITVLQYHKRCLKGVDCDVSLALSQLLVQQRREFLSIIRCCLDLVHSVSCLPEGYLWGGKLSRWQVGAVGTLSSLLGLYMALSRRSSS
ncbi:peroxisomal membrane protein 11C [Anabrus simplex]|uniref:peroxisomal membrane protein 11C n=1 Tax=Anabrus simplex TaxID=316456 RepID=UPI0035A2F7EE